MTNTANLGNTLMRLELEAILSQFANSETYYQRLTEIFGNQYDTSKAETLRIQWQAGDFSNLPAIEVIYGDILGNAQGAYSIENNTIYLARNFLNTAPQDSLRAVILEEIGHYIDAEINDQDTLGDEGELFSNILRRVNLNISEFNRILAEDDTALLSLGGRSLAIEKAEPTILTVTTTLDESDGSATVGTGLSLRDAIIIANNNPTIDYEIRLTGGTTYELRASGINEDNSLTGDLDIKSRTGTLVIIATGTQKAIIDAFNLSNSDRVFDVREGSNLGLDSLIVQGGNPGSDGGGIRVASTGILLLSKTAVSDNLSQGNGGGIFNSGLTYILNGSTVSGNDNSFSGSLSPRGGGIANLGRMLMVDSTIRNNDSSSGGGIYNNSSLTLINTTLNGNTARAGAGLYNNGSLGLVNTTISGNVAQGFGSGGIYVNGGTINIVNSTITNNSSNSNISAGGIERTDGTVVLRNSIIAGNLNVGGGKADLDGTFNGDNNNLIGNLTGATGTVGTGSDIVNPNPGLGSLQNNGGLTQTHALLTGSPAINAGNNARVVSDDEDLDNDSNTTELIPFDGRGRGFNRIVSGTVDIGAFEVQASTLPILSINNLTVVEGRDANAVLALSLNNPSSQAITVNYTTSPVTATANSDYTTKTSTLTIAANATKGTISIPILNDNLNENNETFTITLSDPVNATLGNTKGTVTITDTLQSAVTTTLPTNVENLRLTGNNPINGTGNAGNNRIRGNSGNNILNGGTSNDTLTGAGGVDRFEFKSNRAFVASDFGVDTITDFVVNQDKIVLSKTSFAALTSAIGNGFSQGSNFAVVANNSLVAASNAFIVYSSGTGRLFYNQNVSAAGLGTGASFAALSGNPILTASDFVLVA
jgi:Ca2+-binding RTX toxin-like protein